MKSKQYKTGFTLIEMSIVLVIIGLLTGGILVGKTVLRQARINSIITDSQRYIQAALTFQQKYGALPGDLATATGYWGAASTCPPTNASPLTAGITTTCNGDGNGRIGISGTNTNSYPETFLFWQHLINEKLVEGSLNGSPGSAGTSDHVVGTNAPESKLKGSGFGVNYIGVKSGDTYFFDDNFGHVLMYGGYYSNNFPVSEVLTGGEAYSLDTKIDDGLPAAGTIQTWKRTGYNANCATTSVSSTAAYTSSTAGNSCALIFKTGF